jgi:hypothetical protein
MPRAARVSPKTISSLNQQWYLAQDGPGQLWPRGNYVRFFAIEALDRTGAAGQCLETTPESWRKNEKKLSVALGRVHHV